MLIVAGGNPWPMVLSDNCDSLANDCLVLFLSSLGKVWSFFSGSLGKRCSKKH